MRGDLSSSKASEDLPGPFLQAIEALDLGEQNVAALGSDFLEQVLLGHHMIDFWTNLCVCHSLIVEDGPSGRIFQVQLLFQIVPIQLTWTIMV